MSRFKMMYKYILFIYMSEDTGIFIFCMGLTSFQSSNSFCLAVFLFLPLWLFSRLDSYLLPAHINQSLVCSKYIWKSTILFRFRWHLYFFLICPSGSCIFYVDNRHPVLTLVWQFLSIISHREYKTREEFKISILFSTQNWRSC